MTSTHKLTRLLFVYHAKAGLLSAASDSARKLLGVGACALCSLTHGLFGERPSWRQAKAALEVPVVGVHLDELTPDLERVLAAGTPAVVGDFSGHLQVLVGARELSGFDDVGQLVDRLRASADEAYRVGGETVV